MSEELNLEENTDDFMDYFCNSSSLRNTLEEYVNDLYKALYIFPDKYFNKTVKDIYEDLLDILGK